jgi:hypothetical protein
MTDDQKFFAWLDGELSDAEAAEMEAKVAADPKLKQLAEKHRALGARLRGAFDPIAAAPVPEQVQAALSAGVIDFAEAKRRRAMPALPRWTALAATLAVGIVAGTLIPHGSQAPVEVQGGRLYAASALDSALDTQLASAPSGDVRIGLTFRDQAGNICRSFTQRGSSGLACRADGRWQVHGLFAAPEGQGSDYRMAAGMDPNLAALVDSSMAGEPFDAAQERAAKDKDWK